MKNRILTTLSVLLISITATAQSNVHFMEVRYAEKFRDNLIKQDKFRQDEMVLRIGKASSEFFSLWRRRYNEVQDSILAKGGSQAEVLAARKKIAYPLSNQHQTIYKNLPEKGMLTFTDRIFGKQYIYTEQTGKPKWKILQEKKSIANHSCQKAEAAYLGRKWIVWFTVDIPISDGPWKLWGLPGLILEAEDSESDYQFTCIEIKKTAQGAAISVPKAQYIKCTKEQHIKMKTEYEEQPDKFMKRQGLSEVFAVGKDGRKKPAFSEVKYNHIEK
ncbi:GLPGLI family protein [Bacteroides sp. KG123]|uniref:GLPGLI family protein n=1 Tax=unclassified Bacteroides TaxID=2646097 RepID=UPI003D7FA434